MNEWVTIVIQLAIIFGTQFQLDYPKLHILYIELVTI